MNGLKRTGGNIGNAYLEVHTLEKFCAHAGPEWVIEKALHGLGTYGARFHVKFAGTLRVLGFMPTYADPNVWILDAGDCYE